MTYLTHAYSDNVSLIDLKNGHWLTTISRDNYCYFVRYDNHEQAAEVYLRLRGYNNECA